MLGSLAYEWAFEITSAGRAGPAGVHGTWRVVLELAAEAWPFRARPFYFTSATVNVRRAPKAARTMW
jgi:hypothetical protein